MNNVDQLRDKIDWLACEMFIYEDGTIYGRVLLRGTEAEIDAYINKSCRGHTASVITIPMELADKKLKHFMFNAIAVEKAGTIHHSHTEITGPSGN